MVFCYIGLRLDLSGLYASKYLKRGLSTGSMMSAKTKIKIYRAVIEDVCKEYESTREFIHNKINALCSEHGISADEVSLYNFMFFMPRTQFG